ncbi:MAG TPA: hypothetical protein VGW12_18305 [Pyrinomonadaceae bacterium]|nr:hypothetical protein [Pyrinomonadaceae bacterium]
MSANQPPPKKETEPLTKNSQPPSNTTPSTGHLADIATNQVEQISPTQIQGEITNVLLSPSQDLPPATLSQQVFDARMKAHDFVQEHLKQIITISSAVIAVTVTFLKDIVGTRGDQLRASWLLPVSWLLLGLAICFGVYAIAVHVNNLDWINKKRPNASFAAGANRNSQIPVLITVILFGLGMLSLGGVAAVNYKLFLNRGTSDYKISSAFQAVEEAKKNLDIAGQRVRLNKVELVKGVDESLYGLPVWSVQFEVIPRDQKDNSEGKEIVFPAEESKKLEAITQTYIIDARSGSLLAIR